MQVCRIALALITLCMSAGCGGPGGAERLEPYELRLGTWNIERLGQESDTDVPLVARIIEENFDVIAIQEIMVEDGGHPGYDRLMAELGTSWDGLVTDRPRPDVMASYAEYYAVLWRRGLVRTCPGWSGLVYHEDEPADLFSREPAFVCLEAGSGLDGDGGAVGLDLVLASYHAIYAGGDRDVTRAEVDHLDDVLAAMAAAQPGEQDIVIAGDFNLERADIESLVDAHVLSEGPTGSTLTDIGHISGNLIDHVIVRDASSTAEAGPAQVLDVRGMAATFPAFRETVSNHLPVRALFAVEGDDD
jgi:endonuclease/exonuclease/phosphatase family metal-dependent hydrolase